MKKYRLGDIANVDISGIDKKTKNGEAPVKLCNFVDVYYNWAITKIVAHDLMLASASEDEMSSFILHKGQVAITKDSETRDDIGIAAYIADDFEDVVLGYHCALITPKIDIPIKKRINGKYLNALLHTKYAQKYFSNNATGSGQRYTLSKETIEDMPVYLPALEVQVKIGNYLSYLDNKIELTNIINKELESLAKQIYDYWFVQFDFPNDEGKPYKSSGGKMVWNETLKREIPEGWRLTKTNIFASIQRGAVITEKESIPGEIKVIAAGLDFAYYHNQSNRSKDIITISTSGANAGFVNFWREPIYASDCMTVQCERLIDTLLCFYNLKSYQSFIFNMAHGSAQPHVYPEQVGDVPILEYPEQLKNKLNYLFENVNNCIASNINVVEKFQSLRDYLLPLLMNGQVTIKD